MITNAKLDIFERYKCDGDMFARSGRSSEKELVTDADWELVELLLQDATVVVRKLGSETRTTEAMQRLLENCESEREVERILRMAERPGLCG